MSEEEIKCTKCGGEVTQPTGGKYRGKTLPKYCVGCTQDLNDQYYLDSNAFTKVNEQKDRPKEEYKDYDNYWERELGREGVYE